MSKGNIAIISVFIILLIDQLLKVWVKTNMCIGQTIPMLGPLLELCFTENKGMAFGLELGGDYGKLLLSSFRIIAVGFIGYGLYKLCTDMVTPKGFIISVSFIFAGAVGNIIDSIFYGMVFSESPLSFHGMGCEQAAALFPADGGYGTILHGKVVDMLHCPISMTLPSWSPIWAGETVELFRPIFNIADSAITIGVFLILIFHKAYFRHLWENLGRKHEGTTSADS